MFDRRTDGPAACRAARFIVPLLAGILVSCPVHAQERDQPVVSGSITALHSFTAIPMDLVGHLVVAPSYHALAPWAIVGVRWDGLLAQDAYLVGSLGMRLRRRSVSVALGLKRDVAYHSLQDTTIKDPVLHCRVCRPASVGPPVGPPAASTRIGYTPQPVADAVALAEWNTRRLALGLETGWRLAGHGVGRPWLSATVAAPLVAGLALVASVGQRPDPIPSYNPMGLKLGFTWRAALWERRVNAPPSPISSDSSAVLRSAPTTGFFVYRLPQGVRLRFLAPTAHQVEVQSNLTGWLPVSLQRVADGAWQIDLPASPGVHRLALRVDGGPWVPPPGLTVGSDGYGSTVGVLLVDF